MLLFGHSMTNTTIALYDALISAGVDEDKARLAAEAVFSREETNALATTSDIKNIEIKIDRLRAEMFRFMASQTLIVIGGVVGLLQLLS